MHGRRPSRVGGGGVGWIGRVVELRAKPQAWQSFGENNSYNMAHCGLNFYF